MFYCVRCGDKIEKDELVCDKCGLRFRVVNENGTTVYINQSPHPIANPQVVPQGAKTGANASAQKHVKTKAPKQKKEKKRRYGWIIALASILSVVVVVTFLIIILTSGILLGLVLFSDDTSGEQIVIDDTYTSPSSTTSVAYTPPITYQSDITEPQDEYVSEALRDQFVTLKGDGTDTVTVMVYMIGSDLESEYGMATDDLKEMLNATLSDNVNVVIQTGGCKKWKTNGISNKHAQRYVVENGKLKLVDDSLDQLDFTHEKTLEDFIKYSNKNYPADRNILILWDHGGGVVYGYGLDENVDDPYAALTLDEIQTALANSGVKFEMIGFDSCLMGGIETACAMYDYADYLVVSEDFESGNGWEYQNWLSLLGYNSSTPMTDVGKVIVDDFIKESMSVDTEGVLALIDLRYAKLLFATWTDFAYANETELLTYDYTMSMHRSGRANEYWFAPADRSLWDWAFESEDTMETYCYAVDLMALASTMNTPESDALAACMKSCVLYCSSTSGDAYMTGLSVTLPYGDSDFYYELYDVFSNCGFSSQYLTFLSGFADVEATSYDWDDSGFEGWDTYDSYYDDDNYYDWSDFDWDDYYYYSDWWLE